MRQSWPALRSELDDAGLTAAAVVLPGEDSAAWEGALRIAERGAEGFVLEIVDYGQTRPVLARPDAEEVIEALRAYVLTPLPPEVDIDARERDRLLSWAAPHVADLSERAAEPLVVDVPAGLLMSRFGALDGFLLFPADTSFEARSLPPAVIAQPLRGFVTATTLRFEVQRAAPWFGRPGGGLRFALTEPGVGIRDLVREGRLTQLTAPPSS